MNQHPTRRPPAYAIAQAIGSALRAARTRSTALPALPALTGTAWHASTALASRAWHGRPARLTLRLTAALLLTQTTLHAGAGAAPAAGTLTGIAIWLGITGRADLAPPARP